MNDRLALRVGALHLARLRRNARDAAWAAARLRLRDASLDQSDARYAHDATVAFGHALRLERTRRPHESGHEVERITDEWGRVRPLPWRRIGLAGVAILALALFLISRAPVNPAGQAAGATPAGSAAVVPQASPLRGRSDLVIAVVVTPAPARTAAPTGAPLDIEEPQGRPGAPSTGSGGGTGSGNGGSGSGSGVGTGTASPQPAPTPTVAPTVMILDVTVFDARTRLPLPGACVSDGLVTCTSPGAAITDASGHTQLRLSIGQLWHLEIKKDGYVSDTRDVFSNTAQQSITSMLQPFR